MLVLNSCHVCMKNWKCSALLHNLTPLYLSTPKNIVCPDVETHIWVLFPSCHLSSWYFANHRNSLNLRVRTSELCKLLGSEPTQHQQLSCRRPQQNPVKRRQHSFHLLVWMRNPLHCMTHQFFFTSFALFDIFGCLLLWSTKCAKKLPWMGLTK